MPTASRTIGNYLLAKILEDGRLPDFLRLRDELFLEPEKPVYQFIVQHVEQYRVLPTPELTQVRTGLRAAPTRDPFAFYHDQVMNRAMHGLVQTMLGDVNDILTRDNPVPALDTISTFSETLAGIRTGGQRELVQMADLGDLVLSQLEGARDSGGLTGIPTGWDTLDYATRGWQPGALYLMLARPKMGKTITMLNMADTAHLAGFIPLVISMEMGAEPMARRHFAKRAGLNMKTLQRGQVSTFAEEILREKIAEMKTQQNYYFVEGRFKKDVQEIHSMIQALRPHVVFIDGAYLLKMSKSTARARWELMSDIAQEVKSMTDDCDIPVVASFQFTREVKKKAQDAELGNIQLADALGQLCHAAIGLFEPKDGQSLDAPLRRRVKIIGGREGEGDVDGFEINWNWETMNFSEIREEVYESELIDDVGEVLDDA